jgi:hypothetical protein
MPLSIGSLGYIRNHYNRITNKLQGHFPAFAEKPPKKRGRKKEEGRSLPLNFGDVDYWTGVTVTLAVDSGYSTRSEEMETLPATMSANRAL